MEFLVGGIIIVILLLIMGSASIRMWLIAMAVAEICMVFMFVFYSHILGLYFKAKSGKAYYQAIPEIWNNGGFATFLMEGGEYRNVFPMELNLEKVFYHKDQELNVRFLAVPYAKNKTARIVFDKYSRIVMILGISTSAVFGIGIAVILFALMNF